VAEHLSPQWIAELDAAARHHAGLAEATRNCHLVIEQVVTGASSDTSSDVCWHVAIDDGKVRFIEGPASDPTIRFTTDRTTAEALMTGAITTQMAFMTGRLQVGGDTGALLAHHDVVQGLNDVFAGVDTTIA